MKKILFLLFLPSLVFAQKKALKVINVTETERIERMLSSDEMEGRRTFSPGIEKAGTFIASEFEKIGLEKWNNGSSYLQSFAMIKAKPVSQKAVVDGVELDAKKFLVLSAKAELSAKETSGYQTIQIAKGANFQTEARKALSSKNNTLVIADPSFEPMLARYGGMRSQMFSSQANIIMIIGTEIPKTFSIEVKQELTQMPLANVVGVIPGKSKPNEYVIFSGHYDHLGIRKSANSTDSIFNGANDDAAGTTAMIMLAKYYKKLNNNERTLVFAAFTAEEVGGFGAQYFSRQFDPAQVMAMFNIEMIGTESKWGKNSAYITGYEKTDMGAILQKNLNNTGFEFHPDPYTEQNLFYRSDNATLARLGVPAHTISTSKMDSEPNYHKASDEIGTLDMENMTSIIRAIAMSARGIVAGVDTPSRVDTSSLR